MIYEECIACDACREECPQDAIEEGEPFYTINPDKCTECIGDYDEPSCISACPTDAIIPDNNNVETLEELKYKFLKLQERE